MIDIDKLKDAVEWVENASGISELGDNAEEIELLLKAAQELIKLRENNGWLPISEVLPNKTVLAYFENELGKGRIVKAKYVPKHTVEDNYSEMEFADYCELNDCYFWPEGWYEDVYAETGCNYSFHYIEIEPTYFQYLLPSPKDTK